MECIFKDGYGRPRFWPIIIALTLSYLVVQFAVWYVCNTDNRTIDAATKTLGDYYADDLNLHHVAFVYRDESGAALRCWDGKPPSVDYPNAHDLREFVVSCRVVVPPVPVIAPTKSPFVQ